MSGGTAGPCNCFTVRSRKVGLRCTAIFVTAVTSIEKVSYLTYQ